MISQKISGEKTGSRTAVMACIFIGFLFLRAEAAVKKDVQVVLEQKRLEGLSSSGLTINFLFRVTNSSSSEYWLRKTSTRVTVNQEEFFRLENNLEPPLLIPASSSLVVNVPVKITYAYLFQAIPSLQALESFLCSLTGLFSFVDSRGRETKVPLAATADFPLFRDWEIRIDPLQVKSMSLGGAELEVIVTLVNPNSSPWILRTLTYQLELAGKEVAKGKAKFDDSLGPGGEKKLAIPLLLDFFESGEMLSAALEAEETDIICAGEVEIESEWGKFALPFSHKQKVAVQKRPEKASLAFVFGRWKWPEENLIKLRP